MSGFNLKKRPRTSLTESEVSRNSIASLNLQQEEIRDIQLIQEMLLQEGMDDSQDIQLTPVEEEYDDLDLDMDTMNELELKASQYFNQSPNDTVSISMLPTITAPNVNARVDSSSWKKPSMFDSFKREPDKGEVLLQLEKVQ
jgi:hypothetical protein